MCGFFSIVLDVLAGLAVLFFGWFGWLFLFHPSRYLRAFAEVRLENFQRWELSEEDIARRPPAILYHWLTRRSYRGWLERLAARPEGYWGLLWLVRLGGVLMAVLGVLLASTLAVMLVMQVKTCL